MYKLVEDDLIPARFIQEPFSVKPDGGLVQNLIGELPTSFHTYPEFCSKVMEGHTHSLVVSEDYRPITKDSMLLNSCGVMYLDLDNGQASKRGAPSRNVQIDKVLANLKKIGIRPFLVVKSFSWSETYDKFHIYFRKDYAFTHEEMDVFKGVLKAGYAGSEVDFDSMKNFNIFSKPCGDPYLYDPSFPLCSIEDITDRCFNNFLSKKRLKKNDQTNYITFQNETKIRPHKSVNNAKSWIAPLIVVEDQLPKFKNPAAPYNRPSITIYGAASFLNFGSNGDQDHDPIGGAKRQGGCCDGGGWGGASSQSRINTCIKCEDLENPYTFNMSSICSVLEDPECVEMLSFHDKTIEGVLKEFASIGCSLMDSFLAKERLEHDEWFHVLSQFVFVDRGLWAFMSIVKDVQGYDSQKMKKAFDYYKAEYACPKSCTECPRRSACATFIRSPYQSIKDKKVMRLIDRDEKTVTLEEAREDLGVKLGSCFERLCESSLSDSGERDIYFLVGQTGTGKSYTFLNNYMLPGVVYGTPTHQLKRELSVKYGLGARGVLVWDVDDDFKDEFLPKKWGQLIRCGAKTKLDFCKYVHNNDLFPSKEDLVDWDFWNNSDWNKRLKMTSWVRNYIRKWEALRDARRLPRSERPPILCTQHKAQDFFGDTEALLVFDEDPYSMLMSGSTWKYWGDEAHWSHSLKAGLSALTYWQEDRRNSTTAFSDRLCDLELMMRLLAEYSKTYAEMDVVKALLDIRKGKKGTVKEFDWDANPIAKEVIQNLLVEEGYSSYVTSDMSILYRPCRVFISYGSEYDWRPSVTILPKVPAIRSSFMVLSATPNFKKWEASFKDTHNIHIEKVVKVASKGDRYFINDSSVSRTAIRKNGFNPDHFISPDKPMAFCSYKDVTQSLFKNHPEYSSEITKGFWFGNCSGYDFMGGMDMVICGDDRPNLEAFRMEMSVLDIDCGPFNMYDVPQSYGFCFSGKVWGPRNPTAMKVWIETISNGMLQAVGRVRDLEYECEIHHHGTIPLEGFRLP